MKNIDKYRFLEKFSFLVAARIVLEILQAVFLIYLARKSTHAYGNVMLAFGIGIILCLIADFGLNQLLVLRLSRSHDSRSRILSNITTIKGTLFAVAWLAAAGFVHWQVYDHTLRMVVLIIGIGFGFQSLSTTFFVTLQVNGRQDMEAGIRALAAMLGFGFGIAAIFLNASLWAVAFFKIIDAFICCMLSVIVVVKQTQFRFSAPRLKGLLKTIRGGAIFAFITVAQILNDKINLLFLERYGGSWEIAQYSAAWQLVEGVAMLVVGLVLRSILFPVFARLWMDDQTEAARVAQNTVLWLLLASIPLMFVLYVESNRIIHLVYGPNYSNAVWMQRWLSVTVVMNFMQFTGAYLMMSMGKEKALLLFYVSVLVFNFSWCTVVIPNAPSMGALWAMILSKALIAAMVMTYCQVRMRCFLVRPSLALLVTGATGIILYVLCIRYMTKEFAEIIALFPVLHLAWKWKKRGFHRGLQNVRA